MTTTATILAILAIVAAAVAVIEAVFLGAQVKELRDERDRAIGFGEDALDDLKGRDELLNAYRAANGVLVRWIVERHGPEVAASLPNPDAEPMWFAVEPELVWLDESTGWSS